VNDPFGVRVCNRLGSLAAVGVRWWDGGLESRVCLY
jgi:hypothetical protein